MIAFLTRVLSAVAPETPPQTPTSQLPLPIMIGGIGVGALLIVLFVLIPAIRKSKKP